MSETKAFSGQAASPDGSENATSRGFPADPPGTAARRAALRLLDAVLRKGLPLESALDAAARDLERADDRAFAHAIAAETLRRLPDLDELIDHATKKRLPDDAKARFALRIALVQALAMKTPHHAAISTVLPLVDGGPRKLVHGVFSAVMRQKWALPDVPHLPVPVAERWRKAWGQEAVAAAERLIAVPPPIDLFGEPPADLDGVSLMPGHLRLARGAAIAGLTGYGDGKFWVQDISAAIPARLLGPGDGARPLRGARRQDDAACRRRLGRDRRRRLGKSSRATFRKSGAHRS
jgi:16S rRNA (cytosine967-C5)-methyltransferase